MLHWSATISSAGYTRRSHARQEQLVGLYARSGRWSRLRALRRRHVRLFRNGLPLANHGVAPPERRSRIDRQFNGRRRRQDSPADNPLRGNAVALLGMNAQHPFDASRRALGFLFSRCRTALLGGVGVRRRTTTRALRGGMRAATVSFRFGSCHHLGRFGLGGSQNILRRSNAVLLGPGQLFLRRHAAARTPAMICRPAPAVMMLAGERLRSSLDLRRLRKREPDSRR